jgi:hypothetical protein
MVTVFCLVIVLGPGNDLLDVRMYSFQQAPGFRQIGLRERLLSTVCGPLAPRLIEFLKGLESLRDPVFALALFAFSLAFFSACLAVRPASSCFVFSAAAAFAFSSSSFLVFSSAFFLAFGFCQFLAATGRFLKL